MEPSTLPLLNHPLDEESAFTAEALVSAVRSERGISPQPIPALCVLEFDGDLTDALVANGSATPCDAWACFHTTMFSLQIDGVSFGLIPRTIGGPYAVLVAEQLRASGVKVILGLTSAGRVNPKLRIPSIVIATAAVRDEGTSYHYLPAGSVVEGHGPLVRLLEDVHAGRTATAFARRPVATTRFRHLRGLPVLVHGVSRRAWGLRLRRANQPLALTRLVMLPSTVVTASAP